jgi:hypothetical protein
MQGKLLTIDSDGSAVHSPYVLPDPVCEYSKMYLMEYMLFHGYFQVELVAT